MSDAASEATVDGASARRSRRQLGQLLEGGGVVDRHVRQDLAIELDARTVQRPHQPRIAGAVLAAGGVDPGDPKPAEIPLAQLAADVGVLPGLPQDADRLTVTILAAAPEAFRLGEHALVTAASR